MWSDPFRWRLLALAAAPFVVMLQLQGIAGMPLLWVVVVLVFDFLVVLRELTIFWQRAKQGPALTVLTFENGELRVPGEMVTRYWLPETKDLLTWNKDSLADVRVKPIWPISLSGTGIVEIVSRYDYRTRLAAYPIEPLQRAVTQFRQEMDVISGTNGEK